MSINISTFHRHNITDTCAVWNVLSSRTLYSRAREAGITFICTRFVLYECLFKPRKMETTNDKELQLRLKVAQKDSGFVTYPLDISDLQTIDLLERRKRLGKGELSSIAFALKTRQAFLTDDQTARKLADEVIQGSVTQTTPHLLGWLFFKSFLTNGEKNSIIKEHQEMKRPLTEYFECAYSEACRCRLMENQFKKDTH